MRKALYMMGVLDDADIDWLASNGQRMALTAGDVLIREGEPVGALFIVLQGALKVTSGGKLLATLLSGEIIGEISFVDSRRPMATVSAVQASSVLAVSRADVRAKMAEDTGFEARFYQAVATFLADRLRAASLLRYEARSRDKGEIEPDMMDSVSAAATRFDKLLKRFEKARRA